MEKRINQINIIKFDNPYPSLKEIIFNQETLSSINNFKSIEKGNDNNNNNTTINREKIDANLNKTYILPEGSKKKLKKEHFSQHNITIMEVSTHTIKLL